MNRNQILSMALFTGLAVGVADAHGQAGERRRGPRGGIDVENVMSIRDRLELDDQQIGQLDAWRAERVTRRSEERARIDEMRSQLRAGQIARNDMTAYKAERRDAMRGTEEESRTRLEAILDGSQMQMYEGVMRERRAFARGRASGMRGARGGVRGRASGMRGGRGGVRAPDEMRRGGRRGGTTGFRRRPRPVGNLEVRPEPRRPFDTFEPHEELESNWR
jgi:hypothetical protein